jgi:hypothetical protein
VVLAEELGVEPGGHLRGLHAELLSADVEQPAVAREQLPRQLPFDGGQLHRTRDQFPDGQLFLDLRGHSAGTPVTPDAALAGILRGVGVLAEAIPSTVEERSAMLRSRLAGARMLMLLDNAHDADQVRPLLPGSGNLVVVTSRNQLRGLVAREGAKRLALRSFGKRDATALLAGSVRYDRLHAEPEAVEELAELCGRLPLALTLAGERASRFSELSIAGIVNELRDQRVRLDTCGTRRTPARTCGPRSRGPTTPCAPPPRACSGCWDCIPGLTSACRQPRC